MKADYFFGSVGYVFTRGGIKALNAAARLDIQYTCLTDCGEGVYTMRIPLYHRKRFNRELDLLGVEYEATDVRGLPRLLGRYRKRWGIVAAAVIFAAAVSVSGRYIWSVEVSGNVSVPDETVVETLERLGCGVGTKISDIDFDILHNRFLIECKDIAWISVNMDGTRARVEVKEISRAKTGDSGYYNVVASEDGQIEQISAFEGKPQVKIGDTVRRGELLLSGVIDFRENLLRYESARGEVYAKVNRAFRVEVPLDIYEKKETGREITKKKLKIFNFSVNLYLNSRIPYNKYDTINITDRAELFGEVKLPVWIEKEISREYEETPRHLTEEEARTLALAEYRKKLDETVGDAQLLSKKTAEGCRDGVYFIDCSLYCLADIASRVPIETDTK